MKARISDLSVGIDSNESVAIERKPVTAEAAVDATTKQLVDRSELEALTIKLREGSSIVVLLGMRVLIVLLSRTWTWPIPGGMALFHV